jgi:hypothetical protein
MKIIADLTNLLSGTIIANGVKIPISCNVRTLKDGTRGRAVKEVRRCIPDDYPYAPKPFPKGIWRITAVEWQKDFGFDKWEYGTVRIRTDAWQYVDIWEIDKDGNYFRHANIQKRDYGYLIHYSESKTTLGCIRSATQEEMEILAKFTQKFLDNKEDVELEVL